MDKILFEMTMTAKMMEKESKKLDMKRKEHDKKALDAYSKGDEERMRIFAAEALRAKNTSLQFIRLAARISTVKSRVETAVRMKQFTKQMNAVVAGMGSVLNTMDPEKIDKMMEKFETQFANLDLGVATMDDAISRSNQSATPEDELSKYINMLQAAGTIETGQSLRQTGVGNHPVGTIGQGASAAPEKVAELAGMSSPPGSQQPPASTSTSTSIPPPGSMSGEAVSSSLAARLAQLRK